MVRQRASLGFIDFYSLVCSASPDASPTARLRSASCPKLLKRLVPRVGFELTTYRLRSGCSTAELSGRAGCSRAYLSHRGGGAKPLAGDRAPSREGDRASTPSPGISGDGSISDALTPASGGGAGGAPEGGPAPAVGSHPP